MASGGVPVRGTRRIRAARARVRSASAGTSAGEEREHVEIRRDGLGPFGYGTRGVEQVVSPDGTPRLHCVFFTPKIHWNTGNIGRTCLGFGAQLHLIEPLGFSLDEKQVRRAGLDYWDAGEACAGARARNVARAAGGMRPPSSAPPRALTCARAHPLPLPNARAWAPPVEPKLYDDWDDFLERGPQGQRLLFTKYGDESLLDIDFAAIPPEEDIVLVSGNEECGLTDIKDRIGDERKIGLPMLNTDIFRSFNLSTSASIALWEAYSQISRASRT